MYECDARFARDCWADDVVKDPTGNSIKAWAKEYDESPFFFEQESRYGKRLVAWTDDPDQIEKAFDALLNLLPETVGILLKVCIGKTEKNQPIWSRYHGNTGRLKALQVIRQNKKYVFSDGTHQLCLRDPNGDHYFALDEHGIFFVYGATTADADVFKVCGFEHRCAEFLYPTAHFHHTDADSESLQARFVEELGLSKLESK